MLRIAIDGPAASGKGTIARRLAARFGLAHLDTGLLYRAVAVKVADGEGKPAEVAKGLRPEDLLRDDLRDQEAALGASKVAALPEVRQALLAFQRDFAANPPRLTNGMDARGAVLDGRDIGTEILPEADVKLYVIARPEVRAERRWRELSVRGDPRDLEAVLADIRARDARDAGRADSPMRKAADAVLLDTSELDIDAAVARASALIEPRLT